jgi:DNA repair exonuclease SbcCD nuclease subunit
MRILAVSDLHLDHVSSGISRFEEVERAVMATVVAAIEREADAWVFLGDAMNPNSGSCVFRCLDVLVRATQELTKKCVEPILLAGNHDVIADGRGETTLSPLRSLPDVYVVEDPTHLHLCGVDLACLPYTAPHRGYDAGGFLHRFEGGASPLVVLSHLYVRGAQPGSEAAELACGRDVWLPDEELALIARTRPTIVLNGHHHRAQEHATPSGLKVSIVGSAARLTHGEQDNTPSFLVVDV